MQGAGVDGSSSTSAYSASHEWLAQLERDVVSTIATRFASASYFTVQKKLIANARTKVATP